MTKFILAAAFGLSASAAMACPYQKSVQASDTMTTASITAPVAPLTTPVSPAPSIQNTTTDEAAD